MTSHVSELEDLNTIHITILPKTVYRFIIPIKIQTAFFYRNEKGDPQIYKELSRDPAQTKQ